MNTAQQLINNIEKVIIGKKKVIELATLCLLCKGHVLIEDVPGTGKTMMAKALAISTGCKTKRLQCTPDLLPSDITGVPVFNQKTTSFEFRPGPIFTHILLADEINRATPRAQSALLECMEEFCVSVDGKTYKLPEIFMVIATQNPIDMAGTHVLPEAQLDRFLMKLEIGYPELEEEIAIAQAQTGNHPINSLESVISEKEILEARAAIRSVHADAKVIEYIANIVAATRRHPDLRLGSSPRGTLALLRTSQGLAWLRNKAHITPELVKELVIPVLAHRLIINPHASLKARTATNILSEILQTVPPIL